MNFAKPAEKTSSSKSSCSGKMVDSARWQRVQSLFHEAIALPEPQQLSFLKNQCGDDPKLLSEVVSLLEEDARVDSLLDKDVGRLAEEVLNDAAAAAPPFSQFGPYRVLQAIGEGGMGMVYLAEREDLRNQVAIKILRDAWVSPARRERFASEQRTLAQLNHPSIARLYDADTSPDGTPFFVMEYVAGVPITEYCATHKSRVAERLGLFRHVCEAVLYAHQHAVIHRDLKPSNILVKEDGSIRLLDFGIAKHLQELGESAEQTMAGLRMMTPAYAAPEQVRGEQAGVQTDVYSLGIILYQLLAGRLPFDLSNRTPEQAEKILTRDEPVKPSLALAGTIAQASSKAAIAASKSEWADLDVLCQTAMHKDQQRRYSSVEALIRDIDHYLKGEPLEARPDTLGYRAGKFIARHCRAVATSAATVTVVIALVIFFTVRLARARNAAIAEAARTARIQKFMTNLFQGGDAAAGPADQLRVVTLLDRGVQDAQSLSAEPAIQAQLYETLGSIYQKLGKLDQADTLLQSALDRRKLLFGQDNNEVAQSLIALGQLRADQAKMDQAQDLIQQGLEMEQRHLAADDPAVAKAEVAYGRVLAQRGSYDLAIQVLESAVKTDSGRKAPPADLAASLGALADANYSAGHYERANALYRQALEMDRAIYGPNHPRVAADLGNLGSVQQDLGYYGEAEKFERQAVIITEAYYGKDNPKTANSLTMLGRALLYENKYDDAAASLKEALAIQEHVFGPVHPDVADTLNELGNVASMHDNYDEALTYFNRVADIYRQVYGEHHYLLAIALSNVAYAYSNKKDYCRSEILFRDVVRRFTETLSAENVNTGIARIKLGRTLLRQNRFQDAQVETLAGYQILGKLANPGVSYLQAARKDLAAEYEGLKEPELAAKYRAELSAAQNKPPASAGKH